jgi:hypothetical protein
MIVIVSGNMGDFNMIEPPIGVTAYSLFGGAGKQGRVSFEVTGSN